MTRFLYSLKLHLACIVIGAVLPAIAIIIYSEIERREFDIRNANARVLHLARSMASEQEEITARTRQMLEMFARMPDFQKLDKNACRRILQDVNRDNPEYAGLYAATVHGDVFAASTSFLGVPNLSDRQYFQNAVRSKDFSVGRFAWGRTSGLRVVHYAYPVLHPSGRCVAVVIASFNLDHYRRFITPEEVAESFVLGLTDNTGVRLYRFPETDSNVAGVGMPVSSVTLGNILGPVAEGIYEGVGSDGTLRIYAYRQLRLGKTDKPYMAVFAGISKEKALREAGHARDRNLFLLGLSTLLILVITWFFGRTAILKRMDRLVAATSRIGGGDLSVRTRMGDTKGEFGQLARAFDDMTSSLEERTKALVQSEARYKKLVEYANDMIIGLDTNGYFTFVNPVALRITGYTENEMIGRHYLDFVRPDFREGLNEFYKNQLLSQTINTYQEFPFITRDGQEIWFGQNVQILVEGGRIRGFQGISRDITERKRMEEELRRAAVTDQLTGLFNRRGFIALAQQQLKLAERSRKGLILCFADLDDLKRINDGAGHEEGDKVLVEAAEILTEAFRGSDIVARIGGDEFAVLAIAGEAEHMDILHERLRLQIERHNAAREYHLSMSSGMAYYNPDEPCSIDELMALADTRMYDEKRRKKQC